MKFMHTVCDVCGATIFDTSKIVAYRYGKPIEPIDLAGEHPWCGIGTVCKNCISVLSDYVNREGEIDGLL